MKLVGQDQHAEAASAASGANAISNHRLTDRSAPNEIAPTPHIPAGRIRSGRATAPDVRRLTAERLLIMRSAARHGGHAFALREAMWLLDDCPESRVARRIGAESALALGQIETARRLIAVGLLISPADSRLLGLKSRLDLADGWIAAARRTVGEAIRRWPDPQQLPRPLRITLAHVLASSNHFGAASSLVMRELERRPHDPDLRLILADWLGRAGRADEALALIDSMLRPPLLLWARLLVDAGRLSEAVEQLDHLLNTADPAAALHRDVARACCDRLPCWSGAPGHSSVLSPALDDQSRGADAIEYLLVGAALDRIEALERLGDRRRLVAMAKSEIDSPAQEPALRIRLAESMIEFGRPRLAIELVFRDRGRSTRSGGMRGMYGQRALAVIAVAARMLNRFSLAAKCVARMDAIEAGAGIRQHAPEPDQRDRPAAIRPIAALGAIAMGSAGSLRGVATAQRRGAGQCDKNSDAQGACVGASNSTAARRRLARTMRRAVLGRLILAHSAGAPVDASPPLVVSDSTSISSSTRAGASASVASSLIEAASRSLDLAIAARPGYPDLRYHRATLLAALGSNEDAAADLDAALNINPAYVAARRLREQLLKAA